MTNESHRPIGICSWSLQADIPKVASFMAEIGVRHVHLAVGPGLGPDGGAYRDLIHQQSWTVTSAMINFPQEDYSTLERIKMTGGIVPDDVWETNRQRYRQAVDLTRTLDTPFLSLHIGYIDHRQPEAYQTLLDRTTCLADMAGEAGLTLLLETGQESGQALCDFLETLSHPALAVNFDPANMILYDKDDPIDAVRLLAPWIQHVHIKDALRTRHPGTWGQEVPWGAGEVNEQAFFDVLFETGYSGAFAVEREAGDGREADMRQAVQRIRKTLKES